MNETRLLSQINCIMQGCSCKEVSDVTACLDLFATDHIAPLFVASM